MPPLAGSTCSPYRIGTAVDFHRPACMTEARSIFGANKSCVAPTRIECPLIADTSSADIPTYRPTRLKMSATISAFIGPISPLSLLVSATEAFKSLSTRSIDASEVTRDMHEAVLAENNVQVPLFGILHFLKSIRGELMRESTCRFGVELLSNQSRRASAHVTADAN